MNFDKEFEAWWNKANLGLPSKLGTEDERLMARSAWNKALRLGHHQGMTRAAEIAAQNTHLIANAILTERDKEKK